jgi:hypothetical protein
MTKEGQLQLGWNRASTPPTPPSSNQVFPEGWNLVPGWHRPAHISWLGRDGLRKPSVQGVTGARRRSCVCGCLKLAVAAKSETESAMRERDRSIASASLRVRNCEEREREAGQAFAAARGRERKLKETA